MPSERPLPPIKSDAELEALIPASERTKLEAVEQLRYELRQRFEEHQEKKVERSQFWRDKLIAPAVIVLITVGLSGFGIPMVLKSIDDTRRSTQITAELLQEVAQQTAEMQAAIDARADAIDAYWGDVSRTNAVLGEFALKRDIGDMTVDEFTRQDNLIENDRKRISDMLDRAAEQYSQHLRTFRPWLHRARMRITFTYSPTPGRDSAEQALIALGSELNKVDEWLAQRHDSYEKKLADDIEEVKASRQLFRKQQLPADEYAKRVNLILTRLRVPAPTEGPTYTLSDTSINEILKFIRQNRPSA